MRTDAPFQSTSLFEQALALDPHSVEAASQLANMLAVRAGNRFTDSPAADFRRAEELVAQALAASPRDWFAHHARAAVLRFQGRCDEAIPEYEAVLSLNPNWLNSLDLLAWCKLMTGSIEEVIPLEKQAIRLSPRDPYIYNFYWMIGAVHLLQSHTDEAIVWFEKARSAYPGSLALALEPFEPVPWPVNLVYPGGHMLPLLTARVLTVPAGDKAEALDQVLAGSEIPTASRRRRWSSRAPPRSRR